MLASVKSRADRPYVSSLLRTQAFQNFVDGHIRLRGKSSNLDIQFFDESIDEKLNRSALKIRKVDTPLIRSSLFSISKTVVALSPSVQGVSDSSVYRAWPRFDHRLFTAPRFVKALNSDDVHVGTFLLRKGGLDSRSRGPTPIFARRMSFKDGLRRASLLLTDLNSDSDFEEYAEPSSPRAQAGLSEEVLPDGQGRLKAVACSAHCMWLVTHSFRICDQESADESLRTIDRMREKGLAVSDDAYLCLIDAFGRRGDTRHTIAVLMEMHKSGFTPDAAV